MLLLALLLSVPAQAEEWIHSTAIAMHGTPRYADDFTHFDYVNADAPKGGLLRLNITGTFDSVNPFIVKGRAAEGTTYIYETLMARTQDEPFTLYPLIAESIDVAPDRSGIRFHLNPKAKWQDGQPLTADDVLYSWNILKTKGRPNHRSYYGKVSKAEKNDDHTVTFLFSKTPDGRYDREMPLIMGLMPVLPKHSTQPFDQTSLAPPIASGPYKLSKIEPGRSTTFTRDPNYWGRDLPSRVGTCNFDTIRYDYYRDENVAQEAFTAHQLDARRESDPKRWMEFQRIEKKKPDGFKTFAFPHHRPEPLRAFIFNTRRDLFSDVRVREALAAAFDFDWINRTLFQSAYKRSDSYFANSELASSGIPTGKEKELLKPFAAELPPQLMTTAFEMPHGPMRDNLLHAMTLLKEAGYRVKQGVLFDKTSKPVAFEILLADPQDEKIALEYARMLERLGIKARVRTVDAAQFQARLSDFDYDVVLNKWVNSLSPGNEQAIYWGSQAADIKGSRNYAGIKNPVLDALIEKLTAAETREDLLAAIHAIDRVLLWGYYTVPLYYRGTDLFAIWPNIAVPETVPLYGPVVESWWAKP